MFFSSRGTVNFYQQLLKKLGSKVHGGKGKYGTYKGKGKGKMAGDPDSEDEGSEGDDYNGDDHDFPEPSPLGDMDLFFLHGGMSQQERTRVFVDFSKAKRGLLFCTDVASRGLHLPRVNWIVQATAPTSTAEYVHRVGRTARLDTEGSAVIFLMPSESEYLGTLKAHNLKLSEIGVPDILAKLTGGGQTGGALSHMAKEAASQLQQRCERVVAENDALRDAAGEGFISYVHAVVPLLHPAALVLGTVPPTPPLQHGSLPLFPASASSSSLPPPSHRS